MHEGISNTMPLAFPTTEGASTVMTRLMSKCAESSLMPSDWLASMALIRNGAMKTAMVLVRTNSISASVVFPPACRTRVWPCARVDGPMANTVRPAPPPLDLASAAAVSAITASLWHPLVHSSLSGESLSPTCICCGHGRRNDTMSRALENVAQMHMCQL